ncbi:MAG: hypothetical protein M1836_001924 [Candelina mexicana]|nr:MAG: hypothetical protein M1836_001924 [Candelina mexicana]
MIIYKDIISGDEIISDIWALKEVHGGVYEIDCKKKEIKSEETFDTGANAPSTNTANKVVVDDEQIDTVHEKQHDTADQKTYNYTFDIADAFYLKRVTWDYDRAQYRAWLKRYLKSVREAMVEKAMDEATIKDFETSAQGCFKKVVNSINDENSEFFTGSTGDIDAMIILINYREDGETPYAILWKHALLEEKV